MNNARPLLSKGGGESQNEARRQRFILIPPNIFQENGYFGKQKDLTHSWDRCFGVFNANHRNFGLLPRLEVESEQWLESRRLQEHIQVLFCPEDISRQSHREGHINQQPAFCGGDFSADRLPKESGSIFRRNSSWDFFCLKVLWFDESPSSDERWALKEQWRKGQKKLI